MQGGLVMPKLLTIKEIAELWNISATLVTRYCRDGRIEGAHKERGVWLIPQDAKRPLDGRKNPNKKRARHPEIQKPPAIGVSNYRDACTNYYYVDKTMLIKEFLDSRPKVSLFTRPRRFGKTLAMDMLKTYFEISDEDTATLFHDKEIWQCGEYYQSHQGKYPVIFLSFKDVKYNTWKETYKSLVEVIRLEYERHAELVTSKKVTLLDRYQKIISDTADENDYSFALKYLSQMLREHYGIAPIIIIDEYDTPISHGHANGFYNEIISFMRNLFSGGLKDNDNLSFGFLTGILRVAKESIFSGLNNLKTDTILDQAYSQYFGFTSEEVKEMARYYGVADKFDEICEWYDGYKFGQTDIFNPWSVINYFGHRCIPGHFWENTSDNVTIGDLLEQADSEITENLHKLLQRETITTYVDTNVIYPEIRNNPSSVYSFLLMCGYLRIQELVIDYSGNYMCKVSLPNKEIALVYKKEIINRLHKVVPQSVAIGIQEAIFTRDIIKLQKQLQRYLVQSISCYDIPNENSYHMLLLGLCAIMSDRYFITSNRESGEGRFDIQLMPWDNSIPGFLIEIKAEKDCSEEQLTQLAHVALNQINDRKYDTEMRTKGITTIIKYGIAFCGKRVQIATE